MSYYQDLSPYTYSSRGMGPSTLNVGWLDMEHACPQGDVPDAFTKRLWVLCCQSVLQMRGYHGCEFCQKLGLPITAQRDDKELSLSSAEIRVLGKGDKIYAAPNLIYHYVVEHHYHPPEEFIHAVLEGPLPGSPEYEEYASKYRWARR